MKAPEGTVRSVSTASQGKLNVTETNMKALEESVRSISTDSLIWDASKLVKVSCRQIILSNSWQVRYKSDVRYITWLKCSDLLIF